jgi:hypothetical protein
MSVENRPGAQASNIRGSGNIAPQISGDRNEVNIYAPPEVKRPYWVSYCPLDHDDVLVGRDTVLDALRDSLLGGSRPVLRYLPGVGKTRLVQQLAHDLDFCDRFDGVLWADLGREPQWGELARHWYCVLVGKPPKSALDWLNNDQDWMDAIQREISDRRMLMILDDAWCRADAERLMALGPCCVHVITTRFPQLADELSDLRDQRFEVQKLSPAHAWELLSRLAPDAAEAFPDDVRRIADLADGLPLALRLLGKRLLKASSRGDSVRLQKTINALLKPGEIMNLPALQAGGAEFTLASVIGKSLDALDATTRAAFCALCIFQADPHSFDMDAALACGVDEDRLDELHDLGLIECRRAGGERRYGIHRVLAEFGRTRLDPATSREKHMAAAAHLADLLSTASEDSSDYLAWYRYEQGDWRDLIDDWLYHLAQAGDAERAFMSLLRVFFDAFWWWGYYLRYDYCDVLLKVWRARNIAPEYRDRLGLLELFMDAYPAGCEKRGVGDWAGVALALQAIGAQCDASPERDSSDARQVRGFVDFFLAEALAYGGGEAPAAVQAAVQAYSDAIDHFSASEQQWVSCWIEFYLAQFLWESGDAAAAREHVERSLALEHEDEPVWERDPEVLANDYRLLAELDLAAGDLAGAARAARRAAFYAWLFQGIPEAADDYTREFYAEITRRLAQLLIAHAGPHAADAAWLAHDLFTFLLPARADAPRDDASVAPALRAGDVDALVAALFPRFPDTPDSATECQRQVCLYKNALLDALDAKQR